MLNEPPENQENQEDGGGEMQLANVAPNTEGEMDRQVFFVLHNGTSSLCLICQEAVNCFKRANLERHFQLHHAPFDQTYPPQGNLRNNKIAQGQLKGQQQMMEGSSTVAEKTTEATYEIAWPLARNKKAFTLRDVLIFWPAAEILYVDFTNKEAILKQIKGLQLSDATITRRIKYIVEDIGGGDHHIRRRASAGGM